MPTKLITFLFIFSVVAAVTSYQLQQPAYPILSENLLFQRIDGAKQTLQEFQGKPLLVTFWSPDCRLCLKDIPKLNQLYNKHMGGENFEILALSMYYDRPDEVIQTSARLNMNYPVYFDLQKKLSMAFGRIVATPTSFLVNSSGQIVYQHSGLIDFAELDQKLKQLIG